MKRFFIIGHATFSNRGCEAIIRSTVQLLNWKFSEIEVLVPSNNISYDSKQWPEHKDHGVRFVPYFYPFYAKYWFYLQRFPSRYLKGLTWPFPLPNNLRNTLKEVDAVISVGGDNYSLDYGIPSLLIALGNLAMKEGKPLIILGASIGPFEKDKYFLPVIIDHLSKIDLILVRERISQDYLKNNLGLKTPTSIPDPAFILENQSTDLKPFWPQNSNLKILGLNLSPYIYSRAKNSTNVQQEILQFIKNCVCNHDLSVLLIPHVADDLKIMKKLKSDLDFPKERVCLVEKNLNAPQLKYVISNCSYFFGARTHSTIAAMTNCIPTVSISYSVKARGLNLDIFGHTEHVLDMYDLNARSLNDKLEGLIRNEEDIKNILNENVSNARKLLEIGISKVVPLVV